MCQIFDFHNTMADSNVYLMWVFHVTGFGLVELLVSFKELVKYG